MEFQFFFTFAFEYNIQFHMLLVRFFFNICLLLELLRVNRLTHTASSENTVFTTKVFNIDAPITKFNKNNLLSCATCVCSGTAGLVWHKLGLVLTISFTKNLAARQGYDDIAGRTKTKYCIPRTEC